MPVGAAAGAVDAEDDGLHVVVLAQLAEFGGEAVAADAGGVAPAVDDFALEVKDGDDIGAAALAEEAGGVVGADVIGHGDLLEGKRDAGVVAGGGDLAELVEHVAKIAELVDEVGGDGVLGQNVAVGIDELLQGVGVNGTALANGGLEITPEVVDELLRFLAVGIAHFVEDVRLDGGLVLAVAGDLDVDAVFIEAVLIIAFDDGEAGHFHFAKGVQGDFRGGGGDVVVARAGGLEVGVDGLA